MLLSFIDGVVLDPKEFKNTLAIQGFIPSEFDLKEYPNLSNVGLVLSEVNFQSKENINIKPFVDEIDVATYVLDCSIEKPQRFTVYRWKYIFNNYCFTNKTTIPYQIDVQFNKGWSFSYRPLAILNDLTVILPWYKPSSKNEY